MTRTSSLTQATDSGFTSVSNTGHGESTEWGNNSSLFFFAILLLGLIYFLGTYTGTGNNPTPTVIQSPSDSEETNNKNDN